MKQRIQTATRSAEISVSAATESRTLDLAFSSETPVLRFGEYEILDHGEGAKISLERLNNGAPLLFNHDRDRYIGVVERGTARIDADRVGRARVRIAAGEEGDKILRDVKDGVLTKVSFLYNARAWTQNEKETHEGRPVYRVTDWEPIEISLVTLPADDTVGVGRTFFSDHSNFSNTSRNMNDENNDINNPPAPAPAPQPAPEPARSAPAHSADAERILAFAARMTTLPDARRLAERAVAAGTSFEAFRAELLAAFDARERSKPRETPADSGFSGDFLSSNELRKYSVMRALRAAALPNDRRAQEEAAFEREVSEECARRQSNSRGGVIIPGAALARGVLSVGAGTGLAGTGSNTVATDVLASQFIDLLRNKMSVGALAQVLTGLKGDVAIPRLLTGPAAGWISENGDAPEQSATFGQLKLSPKTISTLMPISHKLLMQSSLTIDAFVSNMLLEAVALGLDKAILYGTGTDGAPLGVANQTGIYSAAYAGTAPTFSEVVGMESEIAAANAELGAMRYVMPARMRGAFKTAKKFANTGADNTIWEPGNTVNGYETIVSNQVSDGDIFFGVWSEVVTAIWGGTEILAEREVKNRQTNIAVFNDVDVAVRHAEAFALLKKPSGETEGD